TVNKKTMADDHTSAQTQQHLRNLNPARKRLDALIGEWNTEILLPGDPSTVICGRAVFEWLEEGFFLVYRSEAARADFPKLIAIIGCDDSLDSYSMLDFD